MNQFLEHTIRVRYAECDRMGFVHHSVFPIYFEEARTEILRKFGISYHDLENEGYIMPVRNMNFTFFKAGKYDDLLTIKIKLTELPKLRWNFSYETHNQNAELLNIASTEMFFVRKENLRPCVLPVKYMGLIENIFNNEPRI